MSLKMVLSITVVLRKIILKVMAVLNGPSAIYMKATGENPKWTGRAPSHITPLVVNSRVPSRGTVSSLIISTSLTLWRMKNANRSTSKSMKNKFYLNVRGQPMRDVRAITIES